MTASVSFGATGSPLRPGDRVGRMTLATATVATAKSEALRYLRPGDTPEREISATMRNVSLSAAPVHWLRPVRCAGRDPTPMDDDSLACLVRRSSRRPPEVRNQRSHALQLPCCGWER